MGTPSKIVSHLRIRLNGSDLPQKYFTHLHEVVVDQHAHLPGMFTLRFHDPDLKFLDEGPFAFQTPLEIGGKDEKEQNFTLIKGEITALEPEFNDGMHAELVVRGYDLTQQLYRVTRSTTYLNVKDSDLANQFASKARLKADVEPTQTVYDHLYQHNQSDLHFLTQRAWRIGYECYVTAEKLVFRKPKIDAAQITLRWGEDLLAFRPRMTLAEQVEEMLVKGWDVQKKQPIVGRATRGALYPNIGKIDQAAAQKGGKLVLVDEHVASQAEADILAAARLNELSGSYIEAEGEAFRRPDLRAGQVIKLEALGQRFSGDYLVTSATHVYSAAGWKTSFQVRGVRMGLLLAQLAPAAADRWQGAVPAVVTNTDDPKGWGRVKIKYPWLSDEDESDWARVLGAGAGPTAGFSMTPAVDDEVAVIFEQGNFGQPVVLGGLWNGQDALPPPTTNAPQGEKPLVRTWHSRTGHHITMHDNADNKLVITTKSGHLLMLDDAKHQILLISKGNLEITFDDDAQEIKIKSPGKIIVKADNEVQVNASSHLKLSAGGNLQLEAQGNLEMKATGSANLQAASQVTVQAPKISLG